MNAYLASFSPFDGYPFCGLFQRQHEQLCESKLKQNYLWNPPVWLLFHGIPVVWPVHSGSWRSARMSNKYFCFSTSSPWWSWSLSMNLLTSFGLIARGHAIRVHMSSGSRGLSPRSPRYCIGVISGFSFGAEDGPIASENTAEWKIG